MKIAIVGFDIEGRATYDYLTRLGGHEITICDQNERLVVPEGVTSRLGDGYLNGLDEFDVIVRTAGLSPRKILAQNPHVGERITTHVNLFLGGSPTTNVIGVTGTKGKGTTSSLITKMLELAGQKVWLGGNIGVPPLTFLSELDEKSWVVLELSSFQLIDLRYSPHLAVCLMVVPEHLDWHANLEEYLTAKEQLFAHQTVEDIAIYFADNENSYRIASAGLGREVPFFAPPGAVVENEAIMIDGQVICELSDLKLLGAHNWQNACAAVTAVWQAGFTDPEPLRQALQEFSGLPHRIELVRTKDGVDWYNDSFSTGLHSTEAAIMAVPEKKVVVLGGYDRMLDIDWFGPFAKAHESEFEKLLLVGQSAERIANILDQTGFKNYELDERSQNMADIVDHANRLVKPGQAVVFSPGFASFDMFKNFEDRGNQFRDNVNAL